jgi:glucose-1-phosphate cytidylyltransferase
MKVVILCGGRGTRLREETEFRPKPMLPIGRWPILWHIMKIYASQGHKDFILCLGYKGEMIKDYFRNHLWITCDVSLSLGRQPKVRFHDHHPEEDWNVTLAETGEDTLTAGRIRRIQRYLGDDENFFLTYGDGVGDVDVNAALKFHTQHGKALTLTAVHPPGRFGELSLEAGNVVRAFNEKPQAESGWINGGFFVASRRVFDYLEVGDEVMFEQEPMRRITSERQLVAYRHEGFWQPMDTFQEFTLLNRLWSEGNAPWKVWEQEAKRSNSNS